MDENNPYARWMADPIEPQNPYAQWAPKPATENAAAPAGETANLYAQWAPKSTAQDVAEQGVLGVYRGANALFNLPNNLVNFAAKKLGYEPPIKEANLAALPSRLVNAAAGAIGQEPVMEAPPLEMKPATTAGRYAGSIGEQFGGMAIQIGRAHV